MPHAAELANKLFTYKYRDTDPFEKQLGYEYQEGSGDGGVVTDGTNALRQRQGDFGGIAAPMQENRYRSKTIWTEWDSREFYSLAKPTPKFAMQISLCNIVSQMDKSKNAIWPKYGNDNPDAKLKDLF